MNRLERTLVVTASLVVVGGLFSLPAALTEFPVNLFALVLTVGVCLLIPKIHQTDEQIPTTVQWLTETSGPWIGFAIAFHNYHGAWDFQGVGIAIMGTIVSAPLVKYRINWSRTD